LTEAFCFLQAHLLPAPDRLSQIKFSIFFALMAIGNNRDCCGLDGNREKQAAYRSARMITIILKCRTSAGSDPGPR
jgi:hypothetical protein